MAQQWKDPKFAAAYSAREKMSAPFAEQLVQQAFETPVMGDLVTLDNACGTGVLTHYLYKRLSDAEKAKIDHTCGDFSPGMVSFVQDRIGREGWKGAKTKLLDATKIALETGSLSHILTNFGTVAILPTPLIPAALSEANRVLRSGGIAGFTIWKYNDFYDFLMETTRRLGDGHPKLLSWDDYVNHPYDSTVDEKERAKWHTLPYFAAALETAGFIDVKSKLYTHTTYDTPEEYFDNYRLIATMLATKWWTEEAKTLWSAKFDDALREVLKLKNADGWWKNEAGEVELVWRAWIVTARKG